MHKALQFLQGQRLMTLAVQDENGPWVANVYYGVSDDGHLYFISPEDTRHSKVLLKDSHVAFSVAWFDPDNHRNRKAIQGLGTCVPAETEEQISMGVHLHNRQFPVFKDRITLDWIHQNDAGAKVWILRPNYMKYWNDELYGEQESEEITMN